MAVLTKPKGQAAHWYHRDGTPQHEMPLKDGTGMRNATLADARKLGLYPSVSAIIGMLHKQGLEKWKINQAILTTLRTPRKDNQPETHYCDLVRDVAYQQVEDAADFGTKVHHEIERFLHWDFNAAPYVPDTLTANYVRPVIDWMHKTGIKIENPEKVVVNFEHGFAGTTDAPYRATKSFGILDYKTNKTKPGKSIAEWPEKLLQISAYFATYWGEAALENPIAWGGNVYISSTEVGRTVAIMYGNEMLKRGWLVFKYLCEVWRHFNEFDPRLPAGLEQIWPSSRVIEISEPLSSPSNGGNTAAPAVATVPPPTTVQSPESPSVPPSQTTQLSQNQNSETDITNLVLHTANPVNNCDGITFLNPQLCKDWKKDSVITIYSWWYHPVENRAKVGFSADGMLVEHGWKRCFKAYASDINLENRAAGKPDPKVGTNSLPIKPVPGAVTPTIPPVPPVNVPRDDAQPAPKPKVNDDKPAAPGSPERLVQLEAMPMGFGKYKKIPLGKVPNEYFVWMLGQMTKSNLIIPDYVREYIKREDVIRAIDTIAAQEAK